MYKFCYSGRLTTRQKRVDLLIDFCLSLNKKGVDFTLDIFGDGDHLIIKELQKIAGVNVVGFKDRWLDDVDESHIFLLFSDYEGCPLSLLEFQKYIGGRVLARRANGIKQYLSNNCLFDTVSEAVDLVMKNSNFCNTLQLDYYFSEAGSKAQVDLLCERVFAK